MKPIYCVLLVSFTFIFATTSLADSVAESQARAVRLYPDLQREDTAINQLFRRLYNDAKANKPDRLSKADWPEKFAKEAAEEIKIWGSGSRVNGPGGIFGIPWRSSLLQVLTALKARPEFTINAEGSTPDDLYLTGGTFSGFEVVYITISLFEDHFSSAQVVIRPNEAGLEASVDHCVKAISQKYQFKPSGISDRKFSEWDFGVSPETAEQITVNITRKGGILLRYSLTALAEKAEAKEANKKIPKGDF